MRDQQRNILLPIIVVGIILIGLGAVIGLSPVEPKGTIADRLGKQNELTRMLSLASTAGIATELDNMDKEYTLFAPTNDAFESVSEQIEDLEEKIYAPFNLLQEQAVTADEELTEKEEQAQQKELEAAQETAEKATTELKTLLENHLVEGIYTAEQLKSTDQLTTISGKVVTISETDAGELQVNGVTITEAGIEADNGRVHVLNGVIT